MEVRETLRPMSIIIAQTTRVALAATRSRLLSINEKSRITESRTLALAAMRSSPLGVLGANHSWLFLLASVLFQVTSSTNSEAPFEKTSTEANMFDAVPWPHLFFAIFLTLLTYLAIKFPYARYVIVLGPLFHPNMLSNYLLLPTLFLVKIPMVVSMILLHAFGYIRIPGWVFTWLGAVNVWWASYLEMTCKGNPGTDDLVRRLNAILLFLTACGTPWMRKKAKEQPQIPLPLGVKDESPKKEYDFILHDKQQAWYQVPHVCSLFLMYVFSYEFYPSGCYAAVYALIVPCWVQFLLGDVRYFIESRVYALYITFMLLGMQCWQDPNDSNKCLSPGTVGFCQRLCDTECSLVTEIRANNTWSWAFLVVAIILCSYGWSRMNLRDTLLGKFLGRVARCFINQ